MEPLSRDIIEEASIWMARLWADDVTQQDHDAFLNWKNAHPNNAYAWDKLEKLQSKFSHVPQSSLSRRVLSPNKQGLSRRELLSISAVSFSALALGMSTYKPTPNGIEYLTATGEMKNIILPDGTEFTMNTDSKIFVDVKTHHKKLFLTRGEVMISKEEHNTPLLVSTSQGNVLPIGTRFSVREHSETTQVSVYEGEVELQPMLGMGTPHLIAGEQAHFNRRSVSNIESNLSLDALWLEQKIMAQATPLIDFVNELARYRRGILNVDSSLADLKLTGIFTTSNIDRTLYNISQILPVEIHYRTPLWVTIKPKY